MDRIRSPPGYYAYYMHNVKRRHAKGDGPYGPLNPRITPTPICFFACIRSGSRAPINRAIGLSSTSELATLGNLESITIGVRIDLDDDPLDRNARCLAAANRLHRNEASSRHLRQRAREVRLCPPAHLHEFGNRLWLPIPNDRKELAVLRSQQPHHGIDRIEARFPRVGWR